MKIENQDLLDLGFKALAKCFFLDLDDTGGNYLFYENGELSICTTDDEGVETQTFIEECQSLEEFDAVVEKYQKMYKSDEQ